MSRFSWPAGAVLLLAWALAACGGGGEQDSPPPTYSRLVSFGDSLSDVGSHSIGKVGRMGGGKYTVNAPQTRIWLELIAAELKLPVPCAAQVGMDGSAALEFRSMPVLDFPGCNAYGQGGSRITEAIGLGNKARGGIDADIGYLTVPVVTQIDTHLSRHGNRFADDELVLLLAGGNDLFVQLGDAGLPAGAVDAMTTAGREMASAAASVIVARGARRVVLVNLPDVSATPFALQRERSIPGSRDLIRSMVLAFNAELAAGAGDQSSILLVDAYRASVDQARRPAQYGLDDVVTPVCDPQLPAVLPLGLSLLCSTGTLVAGATERHLYADLIHPTPYGHRLLAQLVLLEMAKRQWF